MSSSQPSGLWSATVLVHALLLAFFFVELLLVFAGFLFQLFELRQRGIRFFHATQPAIHGGQLVVGLLSNVRIH